MNNNGLMFNEEDEENSDVLDYFFKFLRYWYWIALALILSMGYAYVYLKKYTPVYLVNATLLIKDDKKMNTEILDKLDMGSKSKLVENEIEVLKSRALIGKVVDELNLEVSYWTEGKFRDVELHSASPIKLEIQELNPTAFETALFVKTNHTDSYQLTDQENNNLGTFAYGKPAKTRYGQFTITDRDSILADYPGPIKIIFQNRDGLVSSLIGGLQIELINPQSSLIMLGLETALPDKGKDILAKLLDEYSVASLEDKNREAANTLRFIEERLKIVTRELGDVEQNVESFRKAHGVTSLSSEADTYLKRVEDNDSKLNEMDVQLKLLDGVDEYLNSPQVGIVAPAAMMGVADPILTSYVGQLSELEVERRRLTQTVQAGNPQLETVLAQMRNVKQAIRENLRRQKTSILNSKRALLGSNSRLEGAISAIPSKEREFVDIKRQANIKEDLYLLLLKTREETSISYASTVTDSRVVDAPYSTGVPIRPNKGNVYLIALLVGLALPIAFIAVKEALNNTVQSKREIERKTGMKVFGEVGLQPKEESGEIIDIKSRSFVSEQIRMLRSNMRYLFLDAHESVGKSILITSSISGEGKSFITLNIAASLALLGKKVVVLGMDLRKPKIQEYLKVSNAVGMSNYLIGQLGPAEIIQVTPIENLYIIPSGPIPPNPSELIERGRMKELIATLRQPFDYVIIDTPPIGLVTDAVLLAPYCDVSFYLVRHERTPKMYLTAIKELGEKKVFKSINIIFNAVNYKNSSTYGYGYGYAKGDYYAESVTKKSWINRLVTK